MFKNHIRFGNYNTIKSGLEQNKDLINDVSEKIITNYKSNKLDTKNILEIVYDYIPQKELTNIDSKI